MKSYSVVFGSGDPRGFTGLSPTFIQFWNLASGTTNAPPAIAETVTGKTGVYTFNYGTTQPIAFLLDAATTSPGVVGRFVSGQIDPSDRADEYGATIVGLCSTLTLIGTSNLFVGQFIGTPTSSMGDTATDPATVMGFLRRAQEMAEGDQIYVKGTGALQFYNRAATLMLIQKLITDGPSTTNKS